MSDVSQRSDHHRWCDVIHQFSEISAEKNRPFFGLDYTRIFFLSSHFIAIFFYNNVIFYLNINLKFIFLKYLCINDDLHTTTANEYNLNRLQ